MQPTHTVNSRICYNCQHVYFDPGSPSYSEYTPGSGMSLYCNKDHWHLDNYYSTIQDLARALETAQTCPDYTHSDRANGLNIPEPSTYIEVIVTCTKCGHVLNEYSYGKELFVHCPVCLKVDQVTASDGQILEPYERTKRVKQ